jgi:hypothetical protein
MSILFPEPATFLGYFQEKEQRLLGTPATVNEALPHLQRLGIVNELTARKRNRLVSYADQIDIMNRGTKLPGR